jgi:hypothetical protein
MSELYPTEDNDFNRFADYKQDLTFSLDLGAIVLQNHSLELSANVSATLLDSLRQFQEIEPKPLDDCYGRMLPYEKEQQYAAQIERGYMPLLSNGFEFVIDRRPEGQEDAHISAEEYTRYFSQGQVPVADKDHELHRHDIAHISSYVYVFGCKNFANLARAAATNALSDPSHCETFTNAMDRFGDNMRNIEECQGYGRAVFIGDVNGARLSLNKLVDLKHLHDENYTPDDQFALVTQIEKQLDLTNLRRIAVRRYGTFIH